MFRKLIKNKETVLFIVLLGSVFSTNYAMGKSVFLPPYELGDPHPASVILFPWWVGSIINLGRYLSFLVLTVSLGFSIAYFIVTKINKYKNDTAARAKKILKRSIYVLLISTALLISLTLIGIWIDPYLENLGI
ncbi:hypothetical protein EPO05_03720 [Patescibacteria group bacterium]|nr:MAG: hypothetical protein EPO05_03720 [Patescibacteria group bacterium]